MADDPHLDELLSRYLDGVATADEVAQLDAQLAGDARAADQASRRCLVHRQIAELLAEDALHALMDRFVQGSPGPPKGVFARTESAARGARSRRAAAYVVAATLLISAAATAAWFARGEPSGLPPADVAAAPPTAAADQPFELSPEAQRGMTPVGDAIIATLARVVDANWAAGAEPLEPGAHLSAGSRVALARGMAKVTFECGAEVVLEGPCDFVIESQMLGTLNAGRITADVPRRAFGFAILSPGVDFVDLGTSFGVNVGGDGRTELHVFDGEVLCSPSEPPDSDQRDAIHVEANRAVEFASGSGAASDIAVDAALFSDPRALRPRARAAARGVAGGGPGWGVAADPAVTADPQGRVASWQDILHGDNQSAEDALQGDPAARPRLETRALNGRPAIRFDGAGDFLLTTPLETTDDQTVALVCQYADGAFAPGRRWGGQILNYDGPPSRYLSNLLEPGVLQIGEPLLEDQFRPSLVSAQVFAGFIGRATVESGRIDGVEIGPQSPAIVVYVYDYGRRRATLYVNGQPAGEARAFAPQGITSRKIIGRHAWMENYFHGDLAELLIYNRALPADELRQTTAYLADKYGIATADRAATEN